MRIGPYPKFEVGTRLIITGILGAEDDLVGLIGTVVPLRCNPDHFIPRPVLQLRVRDGQMVYLGEDDEVRPMDKMLDVASS